ncbi:hypothetical protein IFM89_024635 [Coptis chinensis]|uniref:Uncharacterized protein n=1 Tax=Coptis chinensis TaxID=261450 RepID=A0A835M1J9_9MAGN|nr:hypothetical protein IFM89_024635 [Coptis chinensis]
MRMKFGLYSSLTMETTCCTAIIWKGDFYSAADMLLLFLFPFSAAVRNVSSDCIVSEEGILSQKHTLCSHQNPVSFVAWSPGDTVLLTCGNGEVHKLCYVMWRQAHAITHLLKESICLLLCLLAGLKAFGLLQFDPNKCICIGSENSQDPLYSHNEVPIDTLRTSQNSNASSEEHYIDQTEHFNTNMPKAKPFVPKRKKPNFDVGCSINEIEHPPDAPPVTPQSITKPKAKPYVSKRKKQNVDVGCSINEIEHPPDAPLVTLQSITNPKAKPYVSKGKKKHL